ncbi:hypothetical protein LINPERHAP1_LOCUS29903 [Linum perenne]
MLRGARSAIRNGMDTTFWTARWVDSRERLIELVEDAELQIDIDECVASFTTADGTWDYDRLIQLLPAQTVNLVMGMTPLQEERGEDEWVWGGEKNGQLSIKAPYRIVCNLGETRLVDPWLSVWKWKGPNRIRLFLWLALHEKILTNVGRKWWFMCLGTARQREMSGINSISLIPQETVGI